MIHRWTIPSNCWYIEAELPAEATVLQDTEPWTQTGGHYSWGCWNWTTRWSYPRGYPDNSLWSFHWCSSPSDYSSSSSVSTPCADTLPWSKLPFSYDKQTLGKEIAQLDFRTFNFSVHWTRIETNANNNLPLRLCWIRVSEAQENSNPGDESNVDREGGSVAVEDNAQSDDSDTGTKTDEKSRKELIREER